MSSHFAGYNEETDERSILPPRPESSESCIECVKVVLTKIKMNGSNRSPKLLEVIHTDICGHFPHATIMI